MTTVAAVGSPPRPKLPRPSSFSLPISSELPIRPLSVRRRQVKRIMMQSTTENTLPESVVSLLATVDSASTAITNFIRSVRAARTDLAALTRELSDLRLILELLRDDLEVPGPLSVSIVGLLKSCGDVLGRIDGVMTGCWNEALGKARWGFKEKSAADGLKASMQIHRESLSLVLEVANLETANKEASLSETPGEDAEDTRQEAVRVLSEIARLRERVPRARSDSGRSDSGNRGSAPALRCYLEDVTLYAEAVCGVVLGVSREDDPKEVITVMMESERRQKGPVETIAELPDKLLDESRGSDKFFVETNSNAVRYNASRTQPLEAVGPWYPPEHGAIPFYGGHTNTYQAHNELPRYPQHRADQLEPSPVSPYQQSLGRVYTPEPWSAPNLISTSTWQSASPVSKRTSSQKSASSLFDGVASARTSVTTDLFSAFPPPPRKPAYSHSRDVSSLHESISPESSRPATSRRTSSTLSYPSPMPQTRAEIFTPPGNGLGISGLSDPNSMELIPIKRLFDKDKGPTVFHIDITPAGTILSSKHSNQTVKVWSLVTNTLQSVIKVPAKTKVEPRSRAYFIKSHAVVSESMAMIVMTTSFGNTIEVWDWARRKKKQSIEHAHRWASIREDAYQIPGPSLAIYRGDEAHTIDLLTFSRDPSLKKPYGEVTATIDLKQAGLPQMMRFPELVFNDSVHVLVAVSGPRPRDPPNAQNPMLAAWHISDGVGADQQQSSKPFRFLVTSHPELHMALPTSLAARGDLSVSTWVPAQSMPVTTTGGFWNKTVTVFSRFVLVWNMAENTTRIIRTPNVQSVVSPDCRYVAYCDAAGGKFAIIDTANGDEVWSYPNEVLRRLPHFKQLENLKNVTEFAFSGDSSVLTVGDSEGGVGVFKVRPAVDGYVESQQG